MKMDVKLTHSTGGGGGGGGNSPPYAKNEGGGRELSSLCKKMGGEMSTPYYIAEGEMP